MHHREFFHQSRKKGASLPSNNKQTNRERNLLPTAQHRVVTVVYLQRSLTPICSILERAAPLIFTAKISLVSVLFLNSLNLYLGVGDVLALSLSVNMALLEGDIGGQVPIMYRAEFF